MKWQHYAALCSVCFVLIAYAVYLKWHSFIENRVEVWNILMYLQTLETFFKVTNIGGNLAKPMIRTELIGLAEFLNHLAKESYITNVNQSEDSQIKVLGIKKKKKRTHNKHFIFHIRTPRINCLFALSLSLYIYIYICAYNINKETEFYTIEYKTLNMLFYN